MEAEKVNQTAQRSDYFVLLLRLARILHPKPKSASIVERTTSSNNVATQPPYNYVDPKTIPSQKYYSPEAIAERAQKQNKQPRMYNGHDLRGG